MIIYSSESSWYKGNLHTHTTISDGVLAPSKVLELYRDAGYDFIALTDHDKYGPSGFEGGILKLSGIELAYNDMETRVAYHIVGINIQPGVMEYTDKTWGGVPQRMIDHIKAHGGFAVLCHPCWSLMTVPDAMALTGYDAIEIMNSVSDPQARGDSSIFCDTLAARGRVVKTVAVDDAHFYNGDALSSAVYVNAASLDEASIMEALNAGRFYSSNGPTFKRLAAEDGHLLVNASPVRVIRFFSDAFYSPYRRCLCENRANHAIYPIGKHDRFVRVELEDAHGRRAWSQYIDVRGLAKQD